MANITFATADQAAADAYGAQYAAGDSIVISGASAQSVTVTFTPALGATPAFLTVTVGTKSLNFSPSVIA
ncbi:MAG: hypothetical protein O9257_12375, partial [Brevundimonas sp.]|nr:hypothetical protein [Brevundimonas sp.]